MSEFVETQIEFLKGVGPAKAQALQQELGIFTIADLLSHYPFRHNCHLGPQLNPDDTEQPELHTCGPSWMRCRPVTQRSGSAS